MIEHLVQDLRYSVRMLFHNKAWTIVAILTLAMGIGPLAALFSLFDRVFAPLPVEKPEELVSLDFRSAIPGRRITEPSYEQIAAANRTLTGVIAEYRTRFTNTDILVKGRLESGRVEYISGNYFSVIGVHAFRGRTILPEDDLPATTPVAMVSQPFWENSLGGSPDAIGTTILVNRAPFTIVGVWPASFIDARGSQQWEPSGPVRTDIMIPMAHVDQSLVRDWTLLVMGRRMPDVTVDQVRANFDTVFGSDPDHPMRTVVGTRRYGVWGLVDYMRTWPAIAYASYALIIAFFAIPLILSTTNIATFLLSRAEDRRVEIALRLSIGASRWQLIRQLLTESILLAALGGAVSLLFAYWWTKLFANPPFSAYPNLTVNWRTLGFVLMAALPVGIGCGLFPALTAAGNASRMMQSFGVHFSQSKSSRPRTSGICIVSRYLGPT